MLQYYCFRFSSVLGLSDDILMGEVITRMRWHNRNVIEALNNRELADAMTHSFPYYAHLEQPRILSNSLFFIHKESFSLWVYNDNESTLFNPSVSVSPKLLKHNVKFLRDNNDERIYSFTTNTFQKMYEVVVGDFREGTLRSRLCRS